MTSQSDRAVEMESGLPSCAIRIPNGIVHFAHVYKIDVNGKRLTFEMGNYGGPLLLGKRGDPLAKQPSERDPFWAAFGAWMKQGYRRTDENVCIYEIAALRGSP